MFVWGPFLLPAAPQRQTPTKFPASISRTRVHFRKRQFSRTFSYCVYSTQHTFASGGQANETHSPFSPDLFTFTQLVRANASPRRGRAPRGGGPDVRQAGESDTADSPRDSLQQRCRLH